MNDTQTVALSPIQGPAPSRMRVAFGVLVSPAEPHTG